MNQEAIISAAIRNREARAGQIDRLQPRRVQAARKRRELSELLVKAKEGAATLELMKGLSFIPDFFPTPAPLVRKMIEMADIRAGMRILEPSAGKGDIAERILSLGALVYCIEQNETLAGLLHKRGWIVRQADFLECTIADYQFATMAGGFDRVVMNPPFSGGAEIHHVRHAFGFLKPGGRLVAIMSEGPFFRQCREAEGFRSWLDERGGISEQLPSDTFSGPQSYRTTGVQTRIVTIDKP